MSAGEYNFKLEQGATFVREFTYKDGEGVAINITGYSARMQFRPYRESSTLLIEATTVNGKIVLDGAAGKLTLTLTPSDTNNLTERKAVYDLEIQSAGGVVTRLLEGAVEISKQVTR